MFHERSRLNLTDVIGVANPVTGALLKPKYMDIRQRVTSVAADDQFVIPDTARHWSHLGKKYLGDARNWWVIADLSGIVDPFSELATVGVLRVPSTQRFLFDIITE